MAPAELVVDKWIAYRVLTGDIFPLHEKHLEVSSFYLRDSLVEEVVNSFACLQALYRQHDGLFFAAYWDSLNACFRCQCMYQRQLVLDKADRVSQKSR